MERHRNTGNNPNFNTHPADDLTTYLVDLMSRNDAQAQEANELNNLFQWRSSEYELPQLLTTAHGNELQIYAAHINKRKHLILPLGHFSAIRCGFIVYEDLVSADEKDAVEIIKTEARRRREETIRMFNTRPSSSLPRMDYAHPDVQALHTDADTYLTKSDLLVNILGAYNDQGVNVYEPDILVDDFSEATVCFTPFDDDKKQYIGLRIVGSFTAENDACYKRQNEKYIRVAQRVKDSGGALDYLPLDHLVDSGELQELRERALDILAKQAVLEVTEGLTLQTKSVAIARPPSRSSS